jgi:putative transposase
VGLMALGWSVGQGSVTELALEPRSRAKQALIKYGVDTSSIIVHHDQDPVFTSYCWTAQLLLNDCVRISYALNGARDNPEMESFFSRFKTENKSLLLDAHTLEELKILVDERMVYHNGERRHSTIGYNAPKIYLATQWLLL